MKTFSIIRNIFLCALCMGYLVQTRGQGALPKRQNNDSLRAYDRHGLLRLIPDSLFQQDSLIGCPCSADTLLAQKNTNKAKPGKSLKEPFIALNNGSFNYQFLYQSNVDTLLSEKEIVQHNAMLQFNFTMAGFLPLQARVWTRQTNSQFYRDITDVQVAYDNSFYKQQLHSLYREELLAAADEQGLKALQDCLEREYGKWKGRQVGFNDAEMKQRLVEAYEILQVPGITDDLALPDSVNKERAIGLKKTANEFIANYNRYQKVLDNGRERLDSLVAIKSKMQERVQLVKDLVDRPDWQELVNSKMKEDSFSKSLPDLKMPAYMKWFGGVERFSIGRTPLNSSELTAKNISINGLAFEYASWYYLAVAAGGLDFRFREYVVSNTKPAFHPFYMLRIGLGNPQNNHLILSAFSGQKLVSSYGNPDKSYKVSGITLEARKWIGRNIWVQGEIGQSVAPNYRDKPIGSSTQLGFKQDANTAFAFKAGAKIPKLQASLEGAYKKTGTNYQSFSTWQINTALESWHLNWNQYFIHRRLRLTASLKSNEWQNPYLLQAYKANTVFKQVQLTYFQRNWPTVSIGYIPITQLTKMGEQVVEIRYQTFSANIWHQFRLKQTPISSSFSYLKSFDHQDSGYYFQHNSNLMFGFNMFFKQFSSGMTISLANNPAYQCWIFDHKLQVPFNHGQKIIGMGVKVYNYNQQQQGVGVSFNAAFTIWHNDQLSIFVERGYLPTTYSGLIKTDLGNIQYSRAIQFRKTKQNQRTI